LKIAISYFSKNCTARRSVLKSGILLYTATLLILCFAGLSDASVSPAAHRNYAKIKNVRPPRNLVLRSASALVEDQRTGECLVQKQADVILPIASITKLMTAMVVLDAKMNLKESITIASEDVDTLRHSRSRLPVHSSLTRGNALLLALMASENRAAHALGRTYPGGLAAFVAAMNTKARVLGLTDTHFDDPTGISNGNTSSARDLARMVDAAYQYSLIRKFTTSEEISIRLGHRKLKFHNTNVLLRNPRWQIGLSKTGFIDESGRCLVMQFKVAKRPVLIVLLDAPGKSARYDDARRIKQWMEGSQQVRKKHRA
jgi:D-alanyl-D-alanine endopeptidase (penicillin-binding protein 7)